ncbi:MAG: flagellar filament capping protein FliD [Campylobacterales bacterium]|nr:flagellar filament capping protein FliD [Campylobacterales bacterium]
MGISSLGTGSSILTQSVLDQLRAADDTQRVKPITLDIANEGDKQSSLKVLAASMKNFSDSINELKSPTLFNARAASVSGTSVEVTAAENSDIQAFSLNVTNIATKQIEQSGSFAAKTDTIANGAGSMKLNIAGADYTINYDASTTLDGLKTLINTAAGTKVNATVAQIGSADFRLILSSVDTGSTQNITMTDNSVALKDARLTTGVAPIQTGVDANFTFNGVTVTRSSNQVNDLVTGYGIKLKAPGASDVSVTQDRTALTTKVDSFVEKYNSIIAELTKQTKSSTDSTVRGIFSGDSSIKNMKSVIQNMIESVSGGVGRMEDFGFSVDRSGVMSVDKTVLNTKLDANIANVKAFFSGGAYTKADSSVVTLTGAFTGFYDIANGYAKSGGGIAQIDTALSDGITALNDRKTAATASLDAKYEIMKKQYTAYDAMIAKINNASSMFKQMTTTSSTGA